MATDSVELLALQRIDETCMQLQQQVGNACLHVGSVSKRIASTALSHALRPQV